MELTFEKILETSNKLKGSIINTPLVKANKLSSKFNSDIFLKLEILDFILFDKFILKKFFIFFENKFNRVDPRKIWKIEI